MKHFRILLFFLVLNLSSIYAQSREVDTIVSTYVSIKQYRTMNFGPLQKIDSLNLKYTENDTLVLLTNRPRPHGRLVPYTYKDSTFLNLYARTAFGIRNDSTDNMRITRYWKKPINIFFARHLEKNVKREFKRFVNTISNDIDSLSVNYVNKVEASNYIIYTNKDYDYESQINKNNNSGFYMYWKGSAIDKCAVRINSNVYFSKKLQLMEMQRLFVQSLGYFKMLNELPCESYFSSCQSQEKRLTKLDVEFLKYHYGYGICKGISYENFQSLHRELKGKLKSNLYSKVFFFFPY